MSSRIILEGVMEFFSADCNFTVYKLSNPVWDKRTHPII